MNLKADYNKHTLSFHFPAGTSRGILNEKTSYFIKITDLDDDSVIGIGEASLIEGLSMDAIPEFETKIQEVCSVFNSLDLEIFEWNIPIFTSQIIPKEFPSIIFAFETAMYDFLNGGKRIIFKNEFSEKQQPIEINGLIWMGNKDFMLQQIADKLQEGFRTIKLKIGATDWNSEIEILKLIRSKFSADEITLRVDANGAFALFECEEKLRQLATLDIHSIEQPIAPKQREVMTTLCSKRILPIALDEELIGINDYVEKHKLLKQIKPDYIILKPSLLGGFNSCNEWIEIANRLEIGYWITSALESNIGLNAIAQYTYQLKSKLPQGLGTGKLFTNNIDSPLVIREGNLYFSKEKSWDLSGIILPN